MQLGLEGWPITWLWAWRLWLGIRTQPSMITAAVIESRIQPDRLYLQSQSAGS